jgi:serine O-acetyltransferase
MLEMLRADLARYLELVGTPMGRLRQLRALAEAQGVWATVVYRFGQWSNERAPRPLRRLCKAGYLVAFKLTEMATGISLPAHARIGRGLYVGHFGGIVVHTDVVIGDHCSLSHGVTIGVLGGPRPGVPRIGNRVYIGCGAKLLGPICIGDGATIGANAVVLDDVPAGATAVGVPARVVAPRRSTPAADEPTASPRPCVRER